MPRYYVQPSPLAQRLLGLTQETPPQGMLRGLPKKEPWQKWDRPDEPGVEANPFVDPVMFGVSLATLLPFNIPAGGWGVAARYLNRLVGK